MRSCRRVPQENALSPFERAVAAVALLTRVADRHAPAVLASSFGVEDVLLIDLVATHGIPIEVFTLDTGRLPDETHALMDTVRRRYGIAVTVYAPDTHRLEAYVARNGTNAFYDSVALREECCAIRKTEPLARALAGKGAWITGLRREQAVTRKETRVEEHDALHGIPKFNPLADWTADEVWACIRERRVPYNPLHDRGYPSIGCAPCTRAIAPGEDLRAGRWWWERPEHRECGLHRRPTAVPAQETTT